MPVFLFLAVGLALPVIVGFIRSRRERNEDRRHFAAFIGFSAAVVASGLMILNVAMVWWLGPMRYRYAGSFAMDALAVSAITQHLSTLIAVSAGFFSTGAWRISLLVFGPVMFLISFLLAFANFGA